MSGKSIKTIKPKAEEKSSELPSTACCGKIEGKTEPTAAEKLKMLEEEKKKLKDQLLEEKKAQKKEKADGKVKANEKIKTTDDKLDVIQGKIYAYRKLGKAEKLNSKILNEIGEIAMGDYPVNIETKNVVDDKGNIIHKK